MADHEIVKISVVMATYNGEKYIREQLDSILSQDYPMLEVIISDDGSTDDTIKIVSEYVERFSNVKFVENRSAHGIVNNFLNGFKLAQGEWICPSDQDDIWMQHRLGTFANIVDNHDVDVVRSQDEVLYEDGSREPDLWLDAPLLENAIWRNRLKGHTCMFRKDAVVPLLMQSHNVSWDYVIWLMVCTSLRVLTIPDMLSLWRRHPDAVAFLSFKRKDQNQESSAVATPPKKESKWYATFATCHLLKKGTFSTAFQKACVGRADLLSVLLNNGVSCDYKLVRYGIKVLQAASKQTTWNMVRAGVNSMKMHRRTQTHKDFTIVHKLGHLFWAFREPFNQWYCVRNEKHLA